MLIWGSKGETVDLGHVENRHCETCGTNRPFRVILQYTSRHFWYVFRWVTNKRYLFLCDICSRGTELDAAKIEATLDKNPISWFERYSWTVLVALMSFAIVSVFIGAGEKAETTTSYFRNPKVSDIYIVNINRIIEDTNSDHPYCAFRIKNIDSNYLEFDVSNICYNKRRGVDRDISSGKTSAATYYENKPIRVLNSDVKTWRVKGAINDIHRN
jgi:hypothetical protein